MTETARILQLLGPSTGGIRQHVAFLTDELRDRGWNVETAGPAGVLGDLAALDHAVPIPAGMRPRAIPGAWRALRGLLGRYDLVHAHGLTAGWLAALARRGGVPPLVVTVHNLVLDEVAGRQAGLLRRVERRLPARVDAIIAVSPEIAEALGSAPSSGRITVVGAFGPAPRPQRSARDTRTALGIPEAAPLVVCVARLHPQKGLDVLLASTPRLRERVPDVRLAVVGEGPLEVSLRAQVAELRLGDRVVFARPENPADALQAADVVVVPSRWESGPLVLREAMLLGRPVVATPVGMVTELVIDGVTGWLVPVDDPERLAAALAEVLTDPAEARRRAEAGAVRARDLSQTDRVSLVEDVYRASLGRQ